MPGFTDDFEVDVLKAATGQTTSFLATTPATVVYVDLVTTTPTDSAAGTSVSGGAYAMVDTKGLWAVPSAGSVSNSAAVSFPTATAAWGDVVGFNVYHDNTKTKRVAYGLIEVAGTPTPKTIQTGDTASFAIGELVITLD